MSFDEIGDMTDWPGEAEVRRRLRAALPDNSEQGLGQRVTYWRYFRLDMAIGDLVVVPLSHRRAGIARVVGEYQYDATEPSEYLRHRRAVRWIRTVSRDALDPDVRRVVDAPGTICRVKASFPDDWWTS